MKDLFFLEGHSEQNFTESFLRCNCILYTLDIGEFLNNNFETYLINCRSDTAIKPSILKNKWVIQNFLEETRVWIIADLGRFSCFSQFKSDMLEYLEGENITQSLIAINSKPCIEYEYFDNTEEIKKTVLSIYNSNNPNNLKSNISELEQLDLINHPESNKFNALKNFCRANIDTFSKALFSEKYFFRLHSEENEINLSARFREKIIQQ